MWRWLRRLLGLNGGNGGACAEGPRGQVTRGTVERESMRLRRDLLAASVALGRALDEPGGVDALMGEWSGEVDALPVRGPKEKM